MRVIAVIPARYASTRLPGKPLRLLDGRPMLQHVYEAAKKAAGLDDIVIATDDERVLKAASDFGACALLTSPEHASGTDRLHEVMEREPADVYINIQGDEPLLKPDDISRLTDFMRKRPDVDAGTLYASITADEAENPNLVKIVLSHSGRALYFSRSPIPYPRDGGQASYNGHIGVYAYRAPVLRRFPSLPPSPLEETEKLEQLRLLQADIAIYGIAASAMTRGVDTAEDLAAVESILSGKKAEIAPDWAQIRLIITDVDGVLTDGSLVYGPQGEELKIFNARDGLGAILARKNNIRTAILSGRDCAALRARFKDLGIDNLFLGRLDKGSACAEILHIEGVERGQAAFIGDDLPDLEAFAHCGVKVAPANAEPEVKAAADYITKACGGQGVLREVVDKILVARSESPVF